LCARRAECENAADLRLKIQDCLDAGAKAVWAIYPELQVVTVYDQSGVRELRGTQVLEAREILPCFQARATQFFE
jgi:hypothetical protein